MNLEPQDIIINVKKLHKYFNGIHVLKGVDFSAQMGQFISIIGRSGCGKTTLLRCLNCLEILDSGSITIAGISLNRRKAKKAQENAHSRNIFVKHDSSVPFSGIDDQEEILDPDFNTKAHALRSKVGMVFQGLNLFPNMTVLENVMAGPKIVQKLNKDENKMKAVHYLEKVGMDKYLDRMPNQLSGGQAQRVAIARALAMSPQVMLYDEPTSALDPELVEEVMQVMMQLNREGMTQIVVTHSMSFAKNASDSVVYMEEGKIVEMAPPKELFSNPKDERTRSYLKMLLD